MTTRSLNQTSRVSVKLMAGEEASAIAEAACVDNAAASLEDHGAYLTVSNERRLDLNIATIEEELGRPYDVPTLLVVLASYTGQVAVSDAGVTITEALSN
jgi:hypothetical protein